MPHSRARRDADIGRHQHSRLFELHLGEALPEQRREPPGRSRLAMIEKAGFGHEERSDTRSGDPGAPLMPLPELANGLLDVRPLKRRKEALGGRGRQRGKDHPVWHQCGRYRLHGKSETAAGPHLLAHPHDADFKRRLPAFTDSETVRDAKRIEHRGVPGVKNSIESKQSDPHGVNASKVGIYDCTGFRVRGLDFVSSIHQGDDK
jgi:hypothetical protein